MRETVVHRSSGSRLSLFRIGCALAIRSRCRVQNGIVLLILALAGSVKLLRVFLVRVFLHFLVFVFVLVVLFIFIVFVFVLRFL